MKIRILGTCLFFLTAPLHANERESIKTQEENNGFLEDAYTAVKSVLVWTAIPFAAESFLTFLDDSISPQSYYLKNLLRTHAASTRKTTSEHTSERMRSIIQLAVYSLIDDRSQEIQETETELTRRGLELQGRLGGEAGKQRLNFALFKPIFDLLFKETSRAISKEGDLKRAAALVSHTAFLSHFLQPEVSLNEPHLMNSVQLFLSESVKPLDRTAFHANSLKHLASIDSDLTDEGVYNLYSAYLASWILGNSENTASPLANTKQCDLNSSHYTQTPDGSLNKAATVLAGALIPALLCERTPFILNKLIEFGANNIGEALMRPVLIDATSSGRRFLQSFDNAYKGALEARSVGKTEAELRDAQARVTGMLSERSLRTRANVLRILGVLTPKFLSVHRYLSQKDIKSAAGVLADTLVYVRQMNPESKADDRFIARTALSILTEADMKTEGFKEQVLEYLIEFDKSYLNHISVQTYYDELFTNWSRNSHE